MSENLLYFYLALVLVASFVWFVVSIVRAVIFYRKEKYISASRKAMLITSGVIFGLVTLPIVVLIFTFSIAIYHM